MSTISEDELRASGFLKDAYTRERMYEGITPYHGTNRSGMNAPKNPQRTPWKIGVELEVIAKDSGKYDELRVRPSNWFFRETDSSLCSSYGIEFITIPLSPRDAKSVAFWRDFCDFVATRANSWRCETCGLHVHISREIFDRDGVEANKGKINAQTLWALAMEGTETAYKIYGRRRTYSQMTIGGDYADAAKTLGLECLRVKSVADRVKGETTTRKRYAQVNIAPEKTIEFRLGKGSICARRIAAVCEASELFCLWSKITPIYRATEENFVGFMRRKMQRSGGLAQIIGNAEEN